MGKIAWRGVPIPGHCVGQRPHGRVGPVQLVDLRHRPPGEVVLARLGEKVEAGLVDAVGEIETRRAFGNQSPMPRTPTLDDLPPRRVEGEHGSTEVADGPGPLGLYEPQHVQEIVRRVRGALGEPPRHLVQFGQQTGALVAVAGAGLPGQGQSAQQARHGGRVVAWDGR